MRLQVPFIVFGLLQLGLPTGIALEEEGVPRNLRGGRPDNKEDISDRELRPFPYPPPRQRPGQSQRYGQFGPTPYRPYTNQYTYVASGPPPRERPAAPHQHTIQHQHGWPYTNHQFASPPHQHTTRHQHGRFAPAPGDGVNGVYIIGGQLGENANSLSDALGFNKLRPGDPIVFLPQVPVNTPPTRQPTAEPTFSPLAFDDEDED